MPRPTPFTEQQLRDAVAGAACWADALRTLGYVAKGSNYDTIRRWVARWQITVDHFNPNEGRRRAGVSRTKPLETVLVEGSDYSRDALKRRLFTAGLKQRACEMCGQGEDWHGRRMSLVLDHINGVSNDHRLENLRIVCANCAATLETHCGRNLPRERRCAGCRRVFTPRHIRHRYCSRECWWGEYGDQLRGVPHPERRKVERPPYPQLMAEIAELGYCGVGRRYGVSDNAVRKWVRWYRAAADQAGARGPGGGADGTAKHRLRSPP